jgi:hypothetical protein
MPRQTALVFIPESMNICDREKYTCPAFQHALHGHTQYSTDKLFAAIAETLGFTMVKEERILPIIMRPKFVACFKNATMPWDCRL